MPYFKKESNHQYECFYESNIVFAFLLNLHRAWTKPYVAGLNFIYSSCYKGRDYTSQTLSSWNSRLKAVLHNSYPNGNVIIFNVLYLWQYKNLRHASHVKMQPEEAQIFPDQWFTFKPKQGWETNSRTIYWVFFSTFK